MSKKRKKGLRKTTLMAELMKSTGDMTYKTLKRNVVVRGMPFNEVVGGTFPALQNWFHHNRNNNVDTDLLDQYDEWIEAQLKERGADYLIHPQLRLGYIGEKDDEGNVVKIKRVKGIKKKKKKREKTEDGIFKGTKKALTFQCEKEGMTMEDTIEKVKKSFGEISLKSVKIWYKKSQKLRGDESKPDKVVPKRNKTVKVKIRKKNKKK